MAVDDAPTVSEDIDKPLFTDDAVIEEIQRSQNDDIPFWEKPDIQGEQLSLFGDPEPLTSSKPAKEKPKSEFAKGPVVDGVQVYEALAAEIDRGTGFVHGKLRVQDFYEEQHPTIQQLADFLKRNTAQADTAVMARSHSLTTILKVSHSALRTAKSSVIRGTMSQQ